MPVENESASAEQTANAKPAPMTKSDGKVTTNKLEKQPVKVSSQTPPVSQQGHNTSREGNEKSSKRKKDTTSKIDTEHKKRRKDD